jgi:hypothetical protein
VHLDDHSVHEQIGCFTYQRLFTYKSHIYNLSSFLTENTVLTIKTSRLKPFRETVSIDFQNHTNHVCCVALGFLLRNHFWSWLHMHRDLLDNLIVAELVIKIFCHYVTRDIVAVFTYRSRWSLVRTLTLRFLTHLVFCLCLVLPVFQLFHRPKCIVCTFKISPMRAPWLSRLSWVRTLWWWLMKFV